MFRAHVAHHQEVKIALHSLWYHHTDTSEWSKITKIQFYEKKNVIVKQKFCASSWLNTEIKKVFLFYGLL